MPAPFHFPGHYWDEIKGKFFKIEAAGTAPPGAQWSRQEVDAYDRRQKLVDQQQQRRDRRRQRQLQSSPADVGDEGPVVHQQPSKRARYVSGNNNATSSFSSSSSLANGSDEMIRRTLQRHVDLDESREAVTSRLHDRCPRLGHEVGEGAADGFHRPFSGSRAATAAAAFANGLEFKGAVPVLDEYEALHYEAVIAADELPLRTRRTHAVPFAIGRSFPQVLSQTEISCMYVHGEDVNPGAGIVYTNYTGSTYCHGVKGQYIPVNDNGDVIIDFALSPRLIDYLPYQRTRPEEMCVPQPTAICFHESSRNLIVCSSKMNERYAKPVPTVQFFAPEVSDDTSRKEDVTWQFGCNPSRQFVPDLIWREDPGDRGLAPPKFIHQLYSECQSESVNACVASPRGYDALCIVATDAGLRAIDITTTRSIPLQKMNDMNDFRTSRMNPGRPVVSDFVDTVHPRLLYAGLHAQQIFPYDVLDLKRQKCFGMPENNRFTVTSVDFVHKHPRLVVAAGRHPVPWLVDLSDRSWHAFGGTSMVNAYDSSIRIDGQDRGEDNAVTHARSAGEYHVVAASLNNKMLMYDLRYIKNPRSSREEDVVAAALFRFRDYHKSSRLMGLGFDVDAELGLVAAAEEHDYYTGLGGGISLFSLATGERVHAPGLWQFSHSPERLARIYTPTETLLTLPRTTTKEASLLLPATANTSESDYHDFGFDGPESSQTRSSKPFLTVTRNSDRKRYESCAKYTATQSMPRVGALSFAALPREGTSLFVAARARVHKFSLKQDQRDIFYGEDEEDRTKQ